MFLVCMNHLHRVTRVTWDLKLGLIRLIGKPVSYAGVLNSDQTCKKANFRSLDNTETVEGADLAILMATVQEVNDCFSNTLVGYFIGKRLAFPIVENYVKNTWAKCRIMRVMMNSNGFFFKFDLKTGLEQVLENGPWMIRTIPIILNTWTPNMNLTKDDITSVLVWVKLHDVQ